MTSDIKCPICGSKTRLRTAKKDDSKFHVCVNYPNCRGKVAFEDEWEEE
jgi:ssDNA-binding Zn-finger/Zn-ribbon topoisomerase 1